MDLTERHFRSLFDARTRERGISYARRGRVSHICQADRDSRYRFAGSGGKTYRQTISPLRDGGALEQPMRFPVSINCKHVAAVCHSIAAQHTEGFAREAEA